MTLADWCSQDRTLALLKDNWDDFAGQLKQGDELIAKLDEEANELEQLEQEVDGPVRSSRCTHSSCSRSS